MSLYWKGRGRFKTKGRKHKVKTEAEIGVMWPQAKTTRECPEPPEAARGRE